MNADVETYNKYIRKQIADVHAAAKGLSEEQLNRRPDAPGANSGYVIATHVIGNPRAWVLGIVCGQPLRRDRPGEFASSGKYEELEKAACALSGEIEAALRRSTPRRSKTASCRRRSSGARASRTRYRGGRRSRTCWSTHRCTSGRYS